MKMRMEKSVSGRARERERGCTGTKRREWPLHRRLFFHRHFFTFVSVISCLASTRTCEWYKKSHSVTVTACVKAVIPFRVSCQVTSASSLRGLTWFCPLLHPWILPLHPRLFTSSCDALCTYDASIALFSLALSFAFSASSLAHTCNHWQGTI